MADDFQSGICSGSWWNAARSVGFDAIAMSAATPLPSCSVSSSSEALFTWAALEMMEPNATACNDIAVSASSISFQDASPLMDSVSGFSLSPSTMDWSHGLLSSGGKADACFHTMLQQDLNSRSLIQQDSSIVSEQPQTTEDLSMNIFKDMNQSLHIPGSGNVLAPTSYACAATMNCQPSTMMGFSEISSNLSQPSWSDQFSPFVKPLPSTQQYPMDQSQDLSNTAHFWNSSTSPSAASIDRSGFYPPIPSQFTAQTLSHKRSSYDVNMMSNSEGVRAGNSSSTKKSNTSEPVMKKPRIEMPSSLPTFKVRKEKLGDRVTALQQLVSPFGKTDTASVLHETIEYIKFLHDQVRGLTAPYLKDGHSMRHQQSADESEDGEEQKSGIRSRGLCLVPIASTYTMASEIPADFWTPTIREIFSWNSGRADSGFPVMFREDMSSGSYSQQGTFNNSDQIHTGVEGRWPEGNLLNDMKHGSFDQQRLSYGDDNHGRIDNNTIEPALHDGYPRIVIPRPFGTDTESQQSVHNNKSAMHYQSIVSVVARA